MIRNGFLPYVTTMVLFGFVANPAIASENQNDANGRIISIPSESVETVEPVEPVRISPPRLSGPGLAPVQNGVDSAVPDSFQSEPKTDNVNGQSSDSNPSSSDTDRKYDHVAVFTDACHFPMTAPGRYGQQIIRDALVIYEGMQLAIKSDGSYELRFVAGTPRTATVVRLQFQLLTNDSSPLATITIPPITLDPDRHLGLHQPGRSVTVSHKGYSHGVQRAIQRGSLAKGDPGNPKNHDLNVSIRRSGVARFGSIPDKGEYSILPADSDKAANSSSDGAAD